MTVNQKISLGQLSAFGSANGQVLASNGTSLYWATGGNGYTGSQGDIGFTGSQGPQGTTGFTGSQGTQGNLGFTGSQGGTGYTGSKGDTGSTGFTGSLGYTGSKGDQGTTGFVGSQGSVGFTGSQGPQGTFGGAAFNYNYSTNTTHTSTPDGYLNLSNTNLSSANALYIDYIDALGANSYSFLQTIDDSTSAIKGHFSLRDNSNSLNYAMFAITGLHTEVTDHFEVPISYLSGVTSFTNGTNVVITFARTGDIGDTGYTGSTGSIGYTGSAATGNSTITSTTQKFVADGTSNSVTLNALTYSNTNILVTLNGLVLTAAEDFNVSGNTLSFTVTPDNQDFIEVISLSGYGATGYTGSAGTGGGSSTTYRSINGAFAGLNTPFTGTLRRYLTSNSTLTNFTAWVSQTSTSDLKLTLNKNGTAIANVTVAANTYIANSSFTSSMIAYSDYITLDITSGSGTDIGITIDYTVP